MAKISRAQIGAIHSLKAKAGLDDQSYRDMLQTQTGVASAAMLDSQAAGRVIVHLKSLSGQGQGSAKTVVGGPFGKKAQALWISAWHLGLVEERDDAALMAFVRRQTGIDHVNWLQDPKDGAAVIEALKGWLKREGGVDWRAYRNPAACVVAAQIRTLVDAGHAPAAAVVDPTDMDALKARMRVLGTSLRRVRRAA